MENSKIGNYWMGSENDGVFGSQTRLEEIPPGVHSTKSWLFKFLHWKLSYIDSRELTGEAVKAWTACCSLFSTLLLTSEVILTENIKYLQNMILCNSTLDKYHQRNSTRWSKPYSIGRSRSFFFYFLSSSILKIGAQKDPRKWALRENRRRDESDGLAALTIEKQTHPGRSRKFKLGFGKIPKFI